jgi:hypothetical protein
MTNFKHFDSHNENLDEMLARIAESIQLDDTRKKRMETAYAAVEELLNEDEDFFGKRRFEIYPQGSVKIGTTVKPKNGTEFDLDIVVHLVEDWRTITAAKLYNELKRVFLAHETYKSKVELKNRCIRINYAGDFHMDVLPGIQEDPGNNEFLMVPDRALKDWTSSNPRGYADWFLLQAEKTKVTLLEKAFSREDLNLEEFAKKKPLKVVVQLLKMYRDEFFADDPEDATSSIILTTLAAEWYQGEASIYEAIENFVKKATAKVGSGTPFVVVNPKNRDEVLSEQWQEKPKLFERFVQYIDHMAKLWSELKKDDTSDNERVLKSLFSERAYNLGLEAHNMYFSKQEALKARDFSGLKTLSKPQTALQKPFLDRDGKF